MHSVPGFSRALAGAFALALALGLVACGTGYEVARPDGPTTGPDAPVAMFGGEALTLDAFEQAYAASTGSPEEATGDSLAALEDFLERYVNFRLKVKQARELGLDGDSALQAEIAAYRDQLARPYFLDQAVLDEIVRDLYEKQQEEVRASHLLLRVEETALPADTLAAYQRIVALRDSIASGQLAFADAAVRHSEDPSAQRPEGPGARGDLGYFTGGRMVHQFEDAAYGTPVGEVSMPIRTRFGYHLISVADRRARRPDLRARHILIRVQGDSAADSTAARQTLEGIKARVTAGESFEALARQYSDDQASGRNGGDLGFFSTGRMIAPFEEAAFALENPGDVSDVVETRFGYHLIQLVERKAPQTLEEAYPELKRLAAELPLATERQLALGARYRAEYGSTFDTTAVRTALARFDQDSLYFELAGDGFGPDSAAVFATVGSERYTLDEFREAFRRQRPPPPGPDQAASLTREMERFLDLRALDQAIETLEERDPAFRDLLAQYADGVLLFRISEDSVWTPAANDEAGLRAYHAERAEGYRFPERRRVLAFTTPSDSLLRVVTTDLDAGRAPTAILEAYRESPLTLRLDTVYVADSTNTPLDLTLALQPGQHTDVVPERSRLAVYHLDGIEAPRQKTFEEARAEVVSEYQNVLEERWVRRLRERYEAQTYPERLSEAFQNGPPGTEETGVGG